MAEIEKGRAPGFSRPDLASTNPTMPADTDPVIEPLHATISEWQDDLTFEDLLAHHGARDPSRVRVDSTMGPDAEMSFLEREASTKLYDGATSSRLKIIVEFLNLQARHGWSNLAMDDILSTIADEVIAKNLNSKMPRSRVEARKVISDVGLDYLVIHSCPCDKTLYFGAMEKATFCPKCKISRYGTTTLKTTVPRKVLFSS